MRVGRVLDSTVQQFGRGRVGSGMQLSGRTSGVMVMSATVRVRSTIRVGEMQVGERMGGGMVMSTTVRVRSTVWVGETQFGGKTGGGMVMSVAGRREDVWGDGDEHNSSGEVDSMGRGDAIWWEDG